MGCVLTIGRPVAHEAPRGVLTIALSIAVVLATIGTGSAETISFPGHELTLRGELYRPVGSGPFPAVVALHGCAGLYGKDGGLSPRHQDWANRLVAAGFVVLFPDSFGSRGAGPQCKVEDRVTRPAYERKADAIAARQYLQSRGDVRAAAVSLLGWSNGGSTVLYVVGRDRPKWDVGPDFARAVAFYPGCRAPLEHGNWHARLPLLLLIGQADDWTPAQPCEDLASAALAAAEPVTSVVYPGAYHDFDHPSLQVHTNEGLAYTADGGGAAHSGTNPAARADALSRVPAFLVR